MKKVILIFILLMLATYGVSFADSLNLSGEAAILIDADTNQILFEKNPHLKLHPASTTKIMTGILAIELGDLDSIVTVDDEAINLTKGSHIALEPGEQIRFMDLLNALLIESANDSAYAIAKHISGSINAFIGLMNEKAKMLGALHTNFVNPNGLDNENHLTTAYDLSLIAQYAMKNNTFREIISHYIYTIPTTNKKDEERYLKSANKLLYSTQKIDVDGNIVPIKYEGINGVKTGYTPEAQNCLVASAERGNQHLIAVVLKSYGQEVFSDIHKLLNFGFENFEKVNVATKGMFVENIDVIEGVNPIAATIIKDDLPLSMLKGSASNVNKKIIFDDNAEAPLQKGQVVGRIEYYLEGKLLGQVDIVSTIDIERIPPVSIFKKILGKWHLLLIGLIILYRALIITIHKKSKRRGSTIYRIPSSLK